MHFVVVLSCISQVDYAVLLKWPQVGFLGFRSMMAFLMKLTCHDCSLQLQKSCGSAEVNPQLFCTRAFLLTATCLGMQSVTFACVIKPDVIHSKALSDDLADTYG